MKKKMCKRNTKSVINFQVNSITNLRTDQISKSNRNSIEYRQRAKPFLFCCKTKIAFNSLINTHILNRTKSFTRLM